MLTYILLLIPPSTIVKFYSQGVFTSSMHLLITYIKFSVSCLETGFTKRYITFCEMFDAIMAFSTKVFSQVPEMVMIFMSNKLSLKISIKLTLWYLNRDRSKIAITNLCFIHEEMNDSIDKQKTKLIRQSYW